MSYVDNSSFRRKQSILEKKFKAGDKKVMVCLESSCLKYFKQRRTPKEYCNGCVGNHPEVYKRYKADCRHTNKMFKKGPEERAELEAVHAVMIEEFRSRITETKTFKEPERYKPEGTIIRECLRCAKKFKTDSKYRRLCDEHTNNNYYGYPESTHYAVAGSFD